MHTSLNGSPGHDPYAPCSVAELKQTGFQYWALGHIHKRAVFEDKSSAIVMPGIPQGRDINEDGSKTVTLVTVNDDRTVVMEEKTTAVARFERLQIDVSNAADWEDVVAMSKQKLSQHASDVSAQQIVTRVEVIGSSELAWRVRRDIDVLRTELETHGSLLGNLWVEKVKVSSARPRQIAGNFGPIDELANIIEQEIHGSVDFNTEMKAIADELRSQLPTELRGIFGNDQEAFESLMARSANEGTAQVLARLQNSGVE
jgi:DNA repair exonuclease SbcCD nuclease subunit